MVRQANHSGEGYWPPAAGRTAPTRPAVRAPPAATRKRQKRMRAAPTGPTTDRSRPRRMAKEPAAARAWMGYWVHSRQVRPAAETAKLLPASVPNHPALPLAAGRPGHPMAAHHRLRASRRLPTLPAAAPQMRSRARLTAAAATKENPMPPAVAAVAEQVALPTFLPLVAPEALPSLQARIAAAQRASPTHLAVAAVPTHPLAAGARVRSRLLPAAATTGYRRLPWLLPGSTLRAFPVDSSAAAANPRGRYPPRRAQLSSYSCQRRGRARWQRPE